MRSCVVTHEKLPKAELVRVVRTPESSVIVDVTGKANGRGAYLKKDLSVIEKAYNSHILNRILEVEIPDSVFDELKELCK